MTWDDVGQVLVDLEYDDMDEATDHRYQAVTAHVAALVFDPDLAALLGRAALTCHHCRKDDG